MAPIRRRKINVSLLIPFAIVALVFGILIWKKMQDSREPYPVPQASQTDTTRKVVLFFVNEGAGLAREARELPSCTDTEACVKELLDELFSGPVGELDGALPEGAELTGVRLEGDQAVVDVSSAFASDLPSGSSAEMLAVYSIINTVCFNYPQITRVLITVEGNRKTVLKHLDLSDPLTPDYSLEREATSTGAAVPVTTPAPAARKKGQP
jgi:hypothetical protein